ncbi:MAG: cytochrome c oxidase subunit [Chthoniobacter sp.]|nr:cytochrome c oxidase subunit [Chthoniobacter sp.]
MAHQVSSHEVAPHEHHEHHHVELGFWQKYVFSTDHKVIGIQYGVSGLIFLFAGFTLMMLMRWQLAYPGHVLFDSPALGKLYQMIFGDKMIGPDAQGHPGVMSAELYNAFGAMHGTIMVFLGIVPTAFAAFGNFVVPLQIGAPDMAFPKLNMASFWSFLLSGVIMFASFFVPGGAAKSGWTSYSPLANITDQAPNMWLTGQTLWIIGMVFNITGSLLGAINFVTTIIQLRAPGMTWMRMPFFVWANLVTAFLLLLAFPPLEAAAIFQFMDRIAGTSFFLPSGLIVGGQQVHISGGGSPLLWQHLFWFLAHPEVYVLILPGLGIIAEVQANNTRKPLWGYKAMVFAILVLGFLSFIVWAHHMYLTGMGAAVSTFFQTTTILISVPSVVLLTALILSLWGGSIRFTVPMLFATAFLPMFGIGGLTGIPLAFNALDLYLHDTYYVIAHFHYLVAPGTIFAIFAGVYHWFPKATGRMMGTFLGRVHFWASFIFVNGVFMPMFLQGMLGMHRRWYDGGASYDVSKVVVWGMSGFDWNKVISMSAWGLGLAQLPFIFNFFYSIWGGKKIGRNPWDATTLEWVAPSPPPHGNFDVQPSVHRGPYEYSVPGAEADFILQSEPTSATAPAAPALAH